MHAVWNLAAKRARSGLPFVFAGSLIIAVLYIPVVTAYGLWAAPMFPWEAAWVVAVSAVVKASYALFLQRAYARGDFSVVYPLARGTGPLLATVGAIVLLGERPGGVALLGAGFIVTGVVLITLGRAPATQPRDGRGRGVLYGVGTGLFIATYTVWDAHAVAGRGIPPLLFDAGTAWLVLLLLAGPGWVRRAEVAAVWRSHRREVLAVALLSPAAYVLVLTAMTMAPVSYVAPAREVSMLFGAFIGARLLREPHAGLRLVAAAAMLIGVVVLALN